MEIVEIDAHARSGAAGGAAAYLVNVRKEGIVEHSFLTPEFRAVADDGDFALEFVDGEINAFAFEPVKGVFDAVLLDSFLQIVELNFLGFEELAVGAARILNRAGGPS